jgi:DNA polymerase III psi subunit
LDSVGQAFFLLERWAPKSLVLDDSWSDYSALFERIYHLDFDLRSKIYCVLVSKKIKSKDSKEAFSHSVDQVIHEKDLQDFSNLAVQGKNVWQNFWSDYHKFFSD